MRRPFAPASRTRHVQPSDVLEMIDQAHELEARGERVAYLVQGEPHFATPAHIIAAASEAMSRGFTHYPPSEGYLDLREAVADKLSRDNGICADPATEVLITNGASLGLFLAVNAIIEEGDEVLMSDPVYGAYPMLVGAAGGIPVFVPFGRDQDRFVLTRDTLEARVTPRTKAVILNTPGNPLGQVMTRRELEEIAEVATRHDLVLIVDEVYEKFVYGEQPHVSIASISPEIWARTITINSFSKTYAMTGWRIGYTAAPRPLMAAMYKMNQVAGRAAAAFVQRAAVAALRGPQDAVAEMAASYARNREYALREVARVPEMACAPPEGAFYLFLDVRRWGLPSRELARKLLADGHVVLTPGAYYGPRGEGWLRLSFAVPVATLETGLAGLRRALDVLSARM